MRLRHKGFSYQQIADLMNAHSVLTPGGAESWNRNHVGKLLGTRGARELLERLDAQAR